MPPRRLSEWFITINLNVPDSHPAANELIQRFKRALAAVFGFNNLPNILKWGGRKGHTGGSVGNLGAHGVSRDRYAGVACVEIGARTRRIHAHVLIAMMHNGNFQMDSRAIRNSLWVYLGPEHATVGLTGGPGQIYIDIRFLPSREHALRYVSKTLTGGMRDPKWDPPTLSKLRALEADANHNTEPTDSGCQEIR